jgi:hypothetical protein
MHQPQPGVFEILVPGPVQRDVDLVVKEPHREDVGQADGKGSAGDVLPFLVEHPEALAVEDDGLGVDGGVLGEADVNDRLAVFHGLLDANKVPEHDVEDDQLVGTGKGDDEPVVFGNGHPQHDALCLRINVPANLACGQVPRDEPGRGGDDVPLVAGERAAEHGKVVSVERVLERSARGLEAVAKRDQAIVLESDVVTLSQKVPGKYAFSNSTQLGSRFLK